MRTPEMKAFISGLWRCCKCSQIPNFNLRTPKKC
nr:MAG TPA: Ribosomal L37ae protein family [Caudoviricetes sp.]